MVVRRQQWLDRRPADRQLLMLNTGPRRRSTTRPSGPALAKASNAKRYAKISTSTSTRRVTGLFLPGSPYYTKTTYPTFDPAGATKLVSQVAQENGQPVAFTSIRPMTPRSSGRRSSSSRSRQQSG